MIKIKCVLVSVMHTTKMQPVGLWFLPHYSTSYVITSVLVIEYFINMPEKITFFSNRTVLSKPNTLTLSKLPYGITFMTD